MTLIIIFLMLILLELAYFRIADRFNIIDKPNLRSSHKTIVLRGGGIIFLFGIWLYAAFFGLNYPWFILGLSLIGLVSFIDDIRSLPDSVRLVAQFAAMFLMFYQFDILNWQDWWMMLIALIVCVGIINAYNFMDGINGITAAYSAVLLAALMWLDSVYAFADPRLPALTLCAVGVFAYFNFRPRAVCFAGDVGAISVALVTLYMLVSLIAVTGSVWWIVLVAVYGVDTALTVVRRIFRRENIFRAHRLHLYQYLANERRMPHLAVAATYAAVQAAVDLGAWLSRDHLGVYFAAVTVLLSAAYLIILRHSHETTATR